MNEENWHELIAGLLSLAGLALGGIIVIAAMYIHSKD